VHWRMSATADARVSPNSEIIRFARMGNWDGIGVSLTLRTAGMAREEGGGFAPSANSMGKTVNQYGQGRDRNVLTYHALLNAATDGEGW
jgi:hypothetical protein